MDKKEVGLLIIKQIHYPGRVKMDENNQEEKNCLICGKKLSSLNTGDICFCHDVMPNSPQDKELQKKRAQVIMEKQKKGG